MAIELRLAVKRAERSSLCASKNDDAIHAIELCGKAEALFKCLIKSHAVGTTPNTNNITTLAVGQYEEIRTGHNAIPNSAVGYEKQR